MGKFINPQRLLSASRSVLVRPLTRTQPTKIATVRKERYTLIQLVKCQQHVPRAKPFVFTIIRKRLPRTFVIEIVLQDALMIVIPQLQMFNIRLPLIAGLALLLLKSVQEEGWMAPLNHFQLVQLNANKTTAAHLHTSVSQGTIVSVKIIKLSVLRCAIKKLHVILLSTELF
jgi:hypothetical protein